MSSAKPILLAPLEIYPINPELLCFITMLAEAFGCLPVILCLAKSTRALPTLDAQSCLPVGTGLLTVSRKGSKAESILRLAQEMDVRTMLLSFNYDQWLHRWFETRTVNRVLSGSPCPVWVFRSSRFPENERMELYPGGQKHAPFLLSFAPRLLSLPNERRVLLSMAYGLLHKSHERT